MSKRGQLTLFVIVIVAVAAASIGMYMIVKNTGVGSYIYSEELRTYESQIEDCFERRIIDSVWLIGIHGGYVNQPTDNHEETIYGPVAYGLKNGRDIMPTKEEVREDIEEYLEDTLAFCIELEEGINLTVGDVKAEVRINDDNVHALAKVEMFMTGTNSSVKSEKEYKAYAPIRLGRIIDLSHEIIEKQKRSGNQIPVTYLSQFDVDIIFDYYNDDTLLYMIHDDDSTVDDIAYSYIFLAELNNGGSS